MVIPPSSGFFSLTDQHFVLLFHTTHEIMHAEFILKKHRMRYKLIPKPRDIRDDCGLGLVIMKEDRVKAEAYLPPEGIYIKAAFYMRDGKWIRENYPPAPISYGSPPSE